MLEQREIIIWINYENVSLRFYGKYKESEETKFMLRISLKRRHMFGLM